ncbi:MAG: glycoside hydrolase family 10 protein [Kiritimatiellia bacterium]
MKSAVMLVGSVCLLSLTAGCSDPVRIPPPPAAGEARILEGWKAMTNDVQAKKVLGAAPARLLVPGAACLAVDFAGKPARASWDLRLACDLRTQPGIQFDFYCSDLSQFSSFNCYFKSGDGWYSGTFSPEENGIWERVTVLKSSCGVEGTPAGWEKISAIRISGWRAGEGKATLGLANVAMPGGVPDVVVVYADSLAAKGGSEAASYLKFGGTVTASLRAIGIASALIADTDFSPDVLKTARAVVLPYNPSFPADKLPVLEKFVAGGGRLLVCYALPAEIGRLLGMRPRGTVRPTDKGGAALAGFLKKGAGLPGQPDFAPQASWITQTVAPDPGVDVVAEWGSGKRESLNLPALLRSKTGIFMGHVWLGGTEGASAELMQAIVCDLAPSLRPKVDAARQRVQDEQKKVQAWLEGLPSKAGEHRAFWCHSARGLGGDRSWDDSIRFLKDNGFNAIIPNLCWGGVAFYRSNVLPEHPDVASRGDAFDQCLAACRKYGVKCHVWKVCWNMGAYTSKAFENRMVAEKRVQVGVKGAAKTRWLCPSHPDNRALEIEAMVELAKKRPDGIHFDYIRYPDNAHCYCEGCRARFEAAVGRKVGNWPADVTGDKAVPELKTAWFKFRVDNITAVVKGVGARVRKECPGVQISAAVFRSPDADPYTVAQDWVAWCRAGYLDFVCNMDYADSPAMFRSQVGIQKGVVGKTKLYPGIGLSCYQPDGRDAVKMAKQILVVRELGLDGFTVFNFDRRAERVLPVLRKGVTKLD